MRRRAEERVCCASTLDAPDIGACPWVRPPLWFAGTATWRRDDGWGSAEAVAERALVAAQLRAWPMPAYMVPEHVRTLDEDASATAKLLNLLTWSAS